MQLTIYFEPPYWIGVLEQERDGLLYAARHIFGADPGDAEVYEFVQHDLLALIAATTTGVPVEKNRAEPPRKNPKRVLREVRRAADEQGISTKAQEVIRLQLEQHKQERRRSRREDREALEEYKRQRAAEKAKAKHRGH